MADPCAPHVLFIDDHEPARALAELVCERFGWRATTLAAPDLEPDEVAALAPDAVLLDFWYGREPLAVPFLERLRADPATARVPVVLVTAAVPAVVRDRARLDRLIDGVLAKPFGIEELRSVLDRFAPARIGAGSSALAEAAVG